MKVFKSKNNWTFSQKLGKYKSFELDVGYRPEWSYWYVSSNLTRKCDHAGFGLEIEICGAYFWLSIYDGRHWNYKENRWMEQGEENEG